MIDQALLFLVMCLTETIGYVHQKTSIKMCIAALFITVQTGVHPNVHQQGNGETYQSVDMVMGCPDPSSRWGLPQLLGMLPADYLQAV